MGTGHKDQVCEHEHECWSLFSPALRHRRVQSLKGAVGPTSSSLLSGTYGWVPLDPHDLLLSGICVSGSLASVELKSEGSHILSQVGQVALVFSQGPDTVSLGPDLLALVFYWLA